MYVTEVNIIPGRKHEHNGMQVYHRADGALIFHGRRHSQISPKRDRQHTATKNPPKAGYPQAGDGRPDHIGKNKPIHAKKRRKSKKGRRGKR